MAVLSTDHPWAFTFGILGNIISFMVYLAPLPTFYRIYKKKTTEGFQSVPYVVALFSAMLWMYYACLNTDVSLLITINSFGCVIETIFIVMYLIYAPKKAMIFTVIILVLLNVVVFGLILVLTDLLLSEGEKRAKILGWVCVAFSVSVFVAPLRIIRLIIRTKRVELMPFNPSFFLTLIAVIAWFFYGLFSKDIYVALPNVLGFAFVVLQMVLYLRYRTAKLVQKEECKVPEHVIMISNIGMTDKASGVHPINSKTPSSSDEEETLSEEEERKNDNDEVHKDGRKAIVEV